MPAENSIETAHWHDALTFGIEGKAWGDTSQFAQRLPDRAKDALRPELWDRAFTSAGFCVHFRTDSPRIWARWRIAEWKGVPRGETLLRWCGIDLYARDDAGRWRWAGQGYPEYGRTDFEALLTWSEMDRVARDYKLYLPLGSACEALHLGAPRDVELSALPPRTERPIVFYGTSIVHGGSASRPGMPHPHILGRRLDVPIVNLGFPGQGQLDLPIAELMTEIDAAVYVVDCLPNCDAAKVLQRTAEFVRTLRSKRPGTPVVLVDEPDHPVAVFSTSRREEKMRKRAALRAQFRSLVEAGVENLHYVAGAELFGDDGEATLDGVHPSDVGFMRQANAMEPVLRGLLP